MASFLLIHFIFDINSVLDIVNSALAFILFRQQPIDQISDLNLEPTRQLSIKAIEHAPKLLTVFEPIDFNTAEWLSLLILV